MLNRLNENEIHAYVEERLSEYIDKRLAPDEQARVEKHIQECKRCAASLRSLTWTVNLVKQVPAPALPRQFTLPLSEQKRAPTRDFAFRFGMAFAGVVAVFVVAVVTARFFLSGGFVAPAAAPQAAMVKETVVPLGTQQGTDLALTPTPAAETFKSADQTTVTTESVPTQPPRPTSVLPGLFQTTTPVAQPVSPPLTSGGAINTTPSVRTLAALPPLRGVVISETLAVREGPDVSYPELARLKRGDTVNVLGRESKGEWLAIRFSEVPSGVAWVDGRGVRLELNQPVPTVIVPTRTPTPQ